MKKPNIKSSILCFLISSLFLTTTFASSNSTDIGSGDVAKYAIQNGLLKSAMDYVGVSTPGKAIEVWSEGLQRRSAAIQYSVMAKELKEIYEKDLEKGNANWVTGVSSPWVEGYEIMHTEKAGDDAYIFRMKFNTATSTGRFEPFIVTLKVIKDGDFWRISDVKGDKTSTIYTGFIY